MENDIILELKNIYKKYPDSDTYTIENFNLKIKKGEFVTFLGPSGCGKTTILRMVGGFDKPTDGQILLNGEDIANLPPHKRPLNTVFQRYALFSHLDVYDNIAFGLKLKTISYTEKDQNGNEIVKTRKLNKSEINEKVKKALKMVDLEQFETRDISSLSGGQQQRVAIARAIVNEPKILLLDEPLGALDLKMRKDMQLELKEMHRKLGITFIYVTHDQEEALTMSDTIVIINDGQIQQIGAPIDIYNEPKNAFVADFIGESNIYVGTMVDRCKVRFLNKVWECVDDFPINDKVDVVVRPEDIKVSFNLSSGCNAKLVSKTFKGIHYQYVAMVGKNEVTIQSTEDYSVGSEVSLNIDKDLIQIMKRESTTNVYSDGYIEKDNKVCFAGAKWDCDVTQLISGSKLDEEGYLVAPNGKKYDLEDLDVKVEVDYNNIDISDDLEEGNITGKIVQIIWLGDHYQYVVRTEEDEDFVIKSEYTWNDQDEVSVIIKPEDIKLKAKGELSEYEI